LTRYTYYLNTEHRRYMLFTRRYKRNDGILPLLANFDNVRECLGYIQEMKLMPLNGEVQL